MFLKPFVDPQEDVWRGLIQPTSWSEWFASYRAFITHYARMAQEEGVEQLSLGVEYVSSEPREAEWRTTIAAVRAVYAGPLTYAANWEDATDEQGRWLGGGYQNIAWWDALDAIGIDAYFPLSDRSRPSLNDLLAGWKRALDEIEQWRTARGLTAKPVVFTEVGYLSARGAASSPGDYTKRGKLDLELQRRAYEATFRATATRPWLLGLHWWWWDNPSTSDWQGGPKDRYYTPKGKPAERELTRWYRDGGR